jgi:hypothetical protein
MRHLKSREQFSSDDGLLILRDDVRPMSGLVPRPEDLAPLNSGQVGGHIDRVDPKRLLWLGGDSLDHPFDLNVWAKTIRRDSGARMGCR